MREPPLPPANATHDWSAGVDHDHLRVIRNDPRAFAPGGPSHLILEVLAYADDEAGALGRPGMARVTLHADGSISVEDDGRGTATLRDANGAVVRKPVMSTRDLRFFDPPHAARLPDGAPRRGISVVAALSRWLVHTNRRLDGAWTQRYERGIPVDELAPADPVGTTGTTVRFLPDRELVPWAGVSPDEFRKVARFTRLVLDVRAE